MKSTTLVRTRSSAAAAKAPQRQRTRPEAPAHPQIDASMIGGLAFDADGVNRSASLHTIDGLTTEEHGAFAVIMTNEGMRPTMARGDIVIAVPLGDWEPGTHLPDGTPVVAAVAEPPRAAPRMIIGRWRRVGDCTVSLDCDSPGHVPFRFELSEIASVARIVELRTRRGLSAPPDADRPATLPAATHAPANEARTPSAARPQRVAR